VSNWILVGLVELASLHSETNVDINNIAPSGCNFRQERNRRQYFALSSIRLCRTRRIEARCYKQKVISKFLFPRFGIGQWIVLLQKQELISSIPYDSSWIKVKFQAEKQKETFPFNSWQIRNDTTWEPLPWQGKILNRLSRSAIFQHET
jgi:hypothetical protein